MRVTESSRTARIFELAAVALLLAALSAAAVAWVHNRGYTLYFGDAEAHLNIARRVVDTRTPGGSQIGSVWLPLPHILMLPWVVSDTLWRTGLAGAIPSAMCFVAAGILLFASARRVFSDRAAAAAAVGVFALNANMLYLQAIPMTEPVLAATLAGLLYTAVRFHETQSIRWVAAAGVMGALTTLARYEGWSLVPVVTLFFLAAARRRWRAACVFGVIASAGPLLWLAHNWWHWGDALEFYRGPYSAHAIYQRLLDSGMQRFRGDHNWRDAALYYAHAVRLAAGWPAVAMGVAGAAVAVVKRAWWPVALLAAPAILIVGSIHSGGTPIYMPDLWPFSYWNTRFGATALPALAFAAGALVTLAPRRARPAAAVLIAALAVSPWLGGRWPENSICWKESQVNSEGRRAWTGRAAAFFREHYRRGTGIFMTFGDLPGILREAGLPLREGLHQDNLPAWQAAVGRPDLFLREEWAIAIAGDAVDGTIGRAARTGPRYELERTIKVEGQPALHIYRRR